MISMTAEARLNGATRTMPAKVLAISASVKSPEWIATATR
jgi:hypothetical protein